MEIAPPTRPRPERPWGFIITLLVIAAVAATVVGYLGVTGRLGGEIPGQSPGHGITEPKASPTHSNVARTVEIHAVNPTVRVGSILGDRAEPLGG